MTHKFTDRADIGTVNRTSEGYVTARAKAVRSGIQIYRGSELGLVDRDTVRVMRPSDEVFSADSAATFQHVPVTINHPKEMVDASNWREYAVGEVGSKIMRDGEFLAVDLILKDAAAIKAFDGGKKELSAGYTAEIEFVDHADYDAIMKNIRINHLAIVDNARAGKEARIGDSADNWGASPVTTKGPEMELTKVVIGDKAINVAASDADKFTAIIADKDAVITAKDTAIGELKAKLADAESKVMTDEQVAAKVQALADAKAKRDAVAAKFGDEAVKDASDAEIAGMFKVIDAATDDTARKAIGDAAKKATETGWDKILAKKKEAK